ncbi:hypothetical protein BDW74DRAFT_155757, partial [Aspergillus multicolor]|uniref:uncharacterized protein n=1 Tax=Aspergillus multicolor TaxID=41759 RepID=UPI003CCD4345
MRPGSEINCSIESNQQIAHNGHVLGVQIAVGKANFTSHLGLLDGVSISRSSQEQVMPN